MLCQQNCGKISIFVSSDKNSDYGAPHAIILHMRLMNALCNFSAAGQIYERKYDILQKLVFLLVKMYNGDVINLIIQISLPI